jgi:squalene-associated FAD-dependent desaturase
LNDARWTRFCVSNHQITKSLNHQITKSPDHQITNLSASLSFDVVVVGAGFAGLSAAVRLAGAGARVLVLESRARLGGRATAFRDRETGELVDNGQHVLLGCYRETLAFLHEIGAGDFVRSEASLSVTMIDPAGVESRLRCPPLPPPLHLLGGLLTWSALSWRDRLAMLRLAGPIRSAAAAVAAGRSIELASGETVDRWLERHGQTRRLRDMLWEPLAVAALNQPSDVASAAPFVRVLAEMFGGDRSAAAIVLPTRPLHLMYAEPARLWIEERGGSVRTGAPARITVANGQIVSVEAGGEAFRSDAVVCAAPWFALADLFSGDTAPLASTLAAARETKPSPIVTVNLWFDRIVMRESFVGLPGRTLQWVFDKRMVFGESASHLSLVSSGADAVLRWSNDELIAAALAELQGALPQVREARLLRATVIREPRATFSIAPGQPKRPSTQTGIERLFLAGDWIDTGLPATIEGAVRSGRAAAAAVLSCVR